MWPHFPLEPLSSLLLQPVISSDLGKQVCRQGLIKTLVPGVFWPREKFLLSILEMT